MTIIIISDLLPANHPLDKLPMKTCKRCNHEKPIDAFYAQTRREDGKHPWCKACLKDRRNERRDELNARDRERRKVDPDFCQRRTAAASGWRSRNLPHKRAYEKERRERFPEEYKKRVRSFYERNWERMRVVRNSIQRVQYALKKGWLVRPEQCEKCGRNCKPEAAHHDYSKPLEVRWLCRSCHCKWDHHDPKTKKVMEG
jgi:hypothetical protein